MRIQTDSPFLLHWTSDEWQHTTDTTSKASGLSIEFVDIPLGEHNAPLRFTFFWRDENRWEGKDYKIEVEARADTRVRRAAYGGDASHVA